MQAAEVVGAVHDSSKLVVSGQWAAVQSWERATLHDGLGRVQGMGDLVGSRSAVEGSSKAAASS